MKRLFSAVAAIVLLFFMTGAPAIADDASGSETTSVEVTKDAPAEAPVEESEAKEAPAVPVKEEPAALVVPVVPDPVVVAPAPPVEPAPAPVAPEPAAPAPVLAEPTVETPAAPAELVAPAVDSAPVVESVLPDATLPEEGTPAEDPVPVVEAPEVTLDVFVTTAAPLNDQGQISLSVQTKNVPAGTVYGPYVVSLTGAESLGASSTTLTVNEEGSADSTLFWKCATPGATISISGPGGLVPIFNQITGTTATVQTLPILGTPGCGTTTPVQEVKVVTLPELNIVPAGENKPGSVTPKEPVTGATFVVTPNGAIQGEVEWKWVLDPETPETKYVFAEGSVTSGTVNLGEYIDVVPNPGINPAYGGAYVVPSGAAGITPAGLFNTTEYVFVRVTGNAKDGSPVAVASTPQATQGGTDPITAQLDLTSLCGTTAHWSWYASDNESGSPKWTIGGGIVELPACDSNTGIYPAYVFGDVESNFVATLVPEGPFDRLDTATLYIAGPSKPNGSTKTYERVFTNIDGKSSIVVRIDELEKFCGTIQWAWKVSGSDTPLFMGAFNLPACAPQGGDDGDDNENPNPNPWHPGHGHGHGDDDGHHHNGGWNGHAGGPDFDGPTGTPGDLNNDDVVDSSTNNAFVQGNESGLLAAGNALPEVSYWSNDNSSVEDELAETGANDNILPVVFTGLGVLLMGIVLLAWSGLRSRPRRRK